MKLQFSLIPYGMLSKVIPALSQYLFKSELWTKGRASVDDIVAFLYSGRMQLWVVYDEANTLFGHVITEVKEYPKSKMLVIQYCAGEPHYMKHIDSEVYDTLERYAKDAGCAGIEIYGRPGWSRHVSKRGYRTSTMVFEKFFGEVT